MFEQTYKKPHLPLQPSLCLAAKCSNLCSSYFMTKRRKVGHCLLEKKTCRGRELEGGTHDSPCFPSYFTHIPHHYLRLAPGTALLTRPSSWMLLFQTNTVSSLQLPYPLKSNLTQCRQVLVWVASNICSSTKSPTLREKASSQQVWPPHESNTRRIRSSILARKQEWNTWCWSFQKLQKCLIQRMGWSSKEKRGNTCPVWSVRADFFIKPS